VLLWAGIACDGEPASGQAEPAEGAEPVPQAAEAETEQPRRSFAPTDLAEDDAGLGSWRREPLWRPADTKPLPEGVTIGRLDWLGKRVIAPPEALAAKQAVALNLHGVVRIDLHKLTERFMLELGLDKFDGPVQELWRTSLGRPDQRPAQARALAEEMGETDVEAKVTQWLAGLEKADELAEAFLLSETFRLDPPAPPPVPDPNLADAVVAAYEEAYPRHIEAGWHPWGAHLRAVYEARVVGDRVFEQFYGSHDKRVLPPNFATQLMLLEPDSALSDATHVEYRLMNGLGWPKVDAVRERIIAELVREQLGDWTDLTTD
jgi:hypothetical protein